MGHPLNNQTHNNFRVPQPTASASPFDLYPFVFFFKPKLMNFLLSLETYSNKVQSLFFFKSGPLDPSSLWLTEGRTSWEEEDLGLYGAQKWRDMEDLRE